MNMACTLFGLTPVEAMAGVTRHAARALGEQERLGQLKVGMLADFLVWNCGHPAELSYLIGVDQLVSRVVNGRRPFMDKFNGIDMSVWQGRQDPEDGELALRWHDRVQPWQGNREPGVVLLGFACDEGCAATRGGSARPVHRWRCASCWPTRPGIWAPRL